MQDHHIADKLDELDELDEPTPKVSKGYNCSCSMPHSTEEQCIWWLTHCVENATEYTNDLVKKWGKLTNNNFPLYTCNCAISHKTKEECILWINNCIDAMPNYITNIEKKLQTLTRKKL